MLETFTVATFAPHVGDRFRIHPEEASVLDAELTEATALKRGSAVDVAASGRRTPFSLVFRGPSDRLLPQRIYRVEHDALGTFELFLVPIGPDRAGMRYEAVFT